MGYESRLYIVNKFEKLEHETMTYAEKVAMFELCKVYSVSSQLDKYPKTNAYIYSDDGDTQIIEDKYGESLREIPIDDMISILENAMEKESYRRYAPCLAMLKGFNKEDWGDNLVVLHYGH